MRRLSLKKANRGFVWAALLAMAVLFFILMVTPAAGQPRPSELPAPAAVSLESAFSRTPKQPPGLIGKPQSHLAPPKTTPPQPPMPPVIPPSGDQTVTPLPQPVKPKPPACPMYVNDTEVPTIVHRCEPCRLPLTAGDVYVCEAY